MVYHWLCWLFWHEGWALSLCLDNHNKLIIKGGTNILIKKVLKIRLPVFHKFSPSFPCFPPLNFPISTIKILRQGARAPLGSHYIRSYNKGSWGSPLWLKKRILSKPLSNVFMLRDAFCVFLVVSCIFVRRR